MKNKILWNELKQIEYIKKMTIIKDLKDQEIKEMLNFFDAFEDNKKEFLLLKIAEYHIKLNRKKKGGE